MNKVNTTYGEMDESLLEKRVGSEDDSDKTLTWTEYWLKGELVHRSVNMELKNGLNFLGDITTL